MAINPCREWELIGKKKLQETRERVDDPTWDKIRDFVARIEVDPFDDALGAEMIPGQAPVNTRCKFIPGTNTVITWMITIRQCVVTILEIEHLEDIS